MIRVRHGHRAWVFRVLGELKDEGSRPLGAGPSDDGSARERTSVTGSRRARAGKHTKRPSVAERRRTFGAETRSVLVELDQQLEASRVLRGWQCKQRSAQRGAKRTPCRPTLPVRHVSSQTWAVYSMFDSPSRGFSRQNRNEERGDGGPQW